MLQGASICCFFGQFIQLFVSELECNVDRTLNKIKIIEEDDEEETYRIVTTVREDVLHGLISIDSPVGKALLGHRVGDTVHVQVNDKYGYDVEIRKIDKTTDETDDKIRDF